MESLYDCMAVSINGCDERKLHLVGGNIFHLRVQMNDRQKEDSVLPNLWAPRKVSTVENFEAALAERRP
jgi:hypothetical protein